MFDFLLTLLHIVLLAGLILVALIVRKRSKLVLLFCLIPAAASALVSVPEPGEGKLLWQGAAGPHSFEIIQKPKKPRPYLPVNFFIHELQGKPELWDRISKISLSMPSAKVKGVYPAKKFDLIQMGNEWGIVQETFRIDGSYLLEIHLKDRLGNETVVKAPFVVRPQNYLSFKKEMTFFIMGCIPLGIFLFGLAAYLRRKYETKR